MLQSKLKLSLPLQEQELQQVATALSGYDLVDELDAALLDIARFTGCNGLFLLRLTPARLSVQIEAMYQDDGTLFSQRDAQKLLNRVANRRRLHSYASLSHPTIIQDVASVIEEGDSLQSVVSRLRSVLLIPVLGNRYIFGAYRYHCDGQWRESSLNALTMAGNMLGYAKEACRSQQAVKSSELQCIEHLYRMPICCVHIASDNRVIRYNHCAATSFKVEMLQQVASLVQPQEVSQCYATMALVRDGLLTQASCELQMKSNLSQDRARVTFLSLSAEDGTLLMMVEPIEASQTLAPQQDATFNFDGLTGLPNRAYFETLYIDSEPCAAKRSTFVAFINLDRFQVVNNVSGNQAGDRLLCEVSSRLTHLVRRGDVVARLSGDEFGIFMPNIDRNIAEQVAERICQALNHHEFTWEGRKHSVSVSIGLAQSQDPQANISDLLRSANAACRVVKESGRNGWYVYASDDPMVERLNTDMSASVDIIGALANDRFELYYQPIEMLQANNSGLHFEILLRMRCENGELMSPAIFLPAAERFSLAAKVDRWVIDNVLRWGASHLALWQGLSMVSVNLSALSIGDREFMHWLEMRLLAEPELARKLCFEITETAAVKQLDLATELINLLKPMGCKLALDDFGSGFSSFAYLKLLDVDYVKIDGQFVRNLCQDKADQAIVAAICQLGRDMQFEVIAEFVESIEIGKHLAKLGVDYGQGYAIGKPVPLAKLSSSDGLGWHQQLNASG